jgi:rhodanese-related sulfurtransferase
MFKHLFGGAPDSADLDFPTFAKVVAAGEVAVVDVREPHEFAAGHIPGAVNLPLSRFDPSDLPSGKDKPVVILCQAGGRSREALGIALAAGRSDLKHYPGGMNGWRMHDEDERPRPLRASKDS